MSIKRSVVFSFVSQVPAVVFSFASGVCITRLLQQEGRGVFTTLQADVAMLALFLSCGVPAFLVYFLAKGAHPKERVIGLAATIFTVLGLLVAAAMLLAGTGWLDAGRLLPPPAPFFFVFFVGASLLLTLAQSFLAAIFLGEREFRTGNRMYVLTAAANLLAYGGLYWAATGQAGDHVHAVLTVGLAVQAVLTAVWAWHYRAYVRVKPVLFGRSGLLGPALAFSAMGYLADVLNQLNYRLDIWILGDLRGMAELGTYAVAVGVAQFFFMVPEPITRVLQPHLVSDDQAGLLAQFRFWARLCITLVMLGGAVFVSGAELIFPLVYGEVFLASAVPFRLLMPGIVFACISKMLVLLVVRTGQVKYNALASGAGLLITVVLDLWLIPGYGAAGAAIASTMAYFTVMCVVMYVVFRRLGVPWGNYFVLMPADVGRLLRGKLR